jgi:hypothetical protein
MQTIRQNTSVAGLVQMGARIRRLRATTAIRRRVPLPEVDGSYMVFADGWRGFWNRDEAT